MARGRQTVTIKNDQGQFALKLENVLKSRIEEIRKGLQFRIRKKWSKLAKPDHGNAGEHPTRVQGHLRESVNVRRVNPFAIRISTTGPFAARERMVSNKRVISPKRKKNLAIPISWEAKKWSSDGNSARSFPGLKVIRRMNSRDGGEVTEPFGIFLGRSFDDLHYQLVPHAVVIEARKGIDEAVEEEHEWIVRRLLHRGNIN